ncbi:hypothetical protein WKH56_19740 [Priestia sp. SB1]|uniref:hypothetical protein n=1 Tax=Priestia sp. SB1 TaxID=3132359 RepID=UPI00317DE7F4
MKEKTIEIPLSNGYKIFIDNNESEGIMVGLINPNGFTVSDRVLSEESAEWLKKVVK